MKFCIQTSNPKILQIKNKEDETLAESLETCFPLHTEMAFVKWMKIYIPLTYKYDVSIILNDILFMLETLLDKNKGKLYISWPSNTFNAEWNMFWDNDRLLIESEWHSVIGETELLLNGLGVLKISKFEFICEWKSLLAVVINALSECGYTENDVADLVMLKKIFNKISKSGSLYSGNLRALN